MSQSSALRISSPGNVFYIHFDVAGHHLDLETFIKTAESAKNVIGALNDSFFSGDLEYRLVVLPPASGTFLTRLDVKLLAGAAALVAFLETDIGKGYVKGLTGEDPRAWAEKIGEHNRELVEEALDNVASSGRAQDEDCEAGAAMLSEMTRGILQSEPQELERLGMQIGNLPDALLARNEFFEACIEDPEIKGVGFDPEPDFPIPRNTFPSQTMKVRRDPDEEKSEPWFVAVEVIVVTSPNWDREDQTTRKWKGKDALRRDCFFVIEDAEFWIHVRAGELQSGTIDMLKVQWAFQTSNGRAKNRRVLRVLEFNDSKLASALEADSLKAQLGVYQEAEDPKYTPDLFDGM